MAGDLRRHLHHEPIRARPPSALYQLGKFARRHKALVGTTAAFLGLMLGGGAVTAWQAVRLARAERDQAVQEARRGEEVQDALARAAVLREQARSPAGGPARWAEARAMARRAEALADAGPVAPALAERVAVLLRELDDEEKDRQMVFDLDGIRLLQAEVKHQQFDTGAAGPRYAEAFRRYGVDVEALAVAEAARRVRASQVREALLAALDHWAWSAADEGPGRVKLLAVADGADDNPWRRRWREAARGQGRARLKELAGDARALEQPPTVLILLGNTLAAAGLPEEAADFLRQAQRRHPADFWINHDLAYVLMERVSPPRPEEALGYFRAALALRPGSPAAHYNLGNALLARKDWPGAAACYRRALELYPEYASAHHNLGIVLREQGDLAGAVASHRKAIELNPTNPRAHYHLGIALREQGGLDGAVACLRKAVELNPQNPRAHYHLAVVLREGGDFAGAADCLRRALELDPKDVGFHHDLGWALDARGDLDGAAACYRRALELDPKRAAAALSLGLVLQRQEDLPGAVASYRRVLQIDPKHAEAHCRLGIALLQQGHFREALAEARTGHDLDSRQKNWSFPSALAVQRCERFLELDRRLPAVLKGEARPAGPAGYVELATLCRYKRLYAAAERFYREAFTADAKLADDLSARHRYHATCSAALAGCGQGADAPKPDDKDRARLRRQALEWLRAERAAWAAVANRARALQTLARWQTDPDLAGVREPGQLAALPPAERAAWQQLWADAAAVAAKARDGK